jgi:tRNA dimethylallyltransferase
MRNPHPKRVTIVGPTASGKSDLAITIARRFGGEIISADSRQVYRGLDIGSGKVTKRERRLARHHLLDVASPKREYNVSHFLHDAKKAIADIESRGNLPIICGGTHFWIQTLLENQPLPPVKPDLVLRARLERLPTEQLLARLKNRDPRRARSIDPRNRRRLIRALEIAEAIGTVPRLPQSKFTHHTSSLVIALVPDSETLRTNIAIRLKKRLRKGMLAEVRRLHEQGLSWKRLDSLGLEYRYCVRYLRDKMPRKEMEERLFFEIWHFAKRQLTWLRRWERQGQMIRFHTKAATACIDICNFLKLEKRA